MPGTAVTSSKAPAKPADDVLYEVIDGQVVKKLVGAFESLFATTFSFCLMMSDVVKRLGRVANEVLFLINPDGLERRPDVAFVSYERWPKRRAVPRVEAWEVVPDLAVEVVSPSNTAIEVVKKLEDYFRAGVRQVLVIYPEQKLIYSYKSSTDTQILQPGDNLDGGAVLPGFRLTISALFEDEAGDA